MAGELRPGVIKDEKYSEAQKSYGRDQGRQFKVRVRCSFFMPFSPAPAGFCHI